MNSRQSQYMVLAGVLAIVGVLALIGGVMYLTETAHKLPSFFPGYGATLKGKRTKHGDAAIAVAIVLFIVAGLSVMVGRKEPRRA